MGHGRQLSNEEKSVVFALSKLNLGQREIAARVNRSKTAVQHVLAKKTSQKHSKRLGRKAKTTANTRQLIVRTILRERLSGSQAVKKLGLNSQSGRYNASFKTIKPRVCEDAARPPPHLIPSRETPHVGTRDGGERHVVLAESNFYRRKTLVLRRPRWLQPLLG